ncbi:MFS transporter [Streptomyces verrucosisporus]|uniref:MFS transporter n=1 Tax=Streptomyces verrucosisporus TaxID=1695161 RepID=UPI0019D2F55C|nr:MFS transporter [Streptomyces verrucosisporus]MBN3931204.1 MFS transporter [Streptomyces verrucosisporus]
MKTVRAVRGFPLAVRLLLINQFGVNTGFYLLIPYLALHLDEDLGMSAALIGVVLGVRNLSQQGLFIIGGSAADRLGARGVIIAGCALRTVGFGLFALGDSLTVLLAASVLSGLAGALFNPAVRAYISVEAGERRAEAFALFQLFATCGALTGPLLGSALLLLDFRTSALTAAGIFAVLTVAQALVLPAREVERTGRPGVLGDWREVLANRRFLAFALALTGMFTLETQLYLLLPDGARTATGQAWAAGLVLLTGTVAGLALQLRITARLKRLGSRGRWISTGLALMGLAFVPPLLVTGRVGGGPPDTAAAAALRLLPVLAGAFLLYLGVMVAQPFVMELIPAFGRESLTGTHFGIFYVVSGIAAAAGNAAVGWTMDIGERLERPWLPWVCCLAFGLLSAAGVTLLRRRAVLPEPAPAHRTASPREVVS